MARPFAKSPRLLWAAALRHGARGLEIKHPDANATQGPFRLWDMAMVQAQVGEHGAALRSLDLVLRIPSGYSVHDVEAEGAFDSLRKLPGYRDLVARYSTEVYQPFAPAE